MLSSQPVQRRIRSLQEIWPKTL